jgi:hypothetical protein
MRGQFFGKFIVASHRLAHRIGRQIAPAQRIHRHETRHRRIDQHAEMAASGARQRQAVSSLAVVSSVWSA